MDINNENTSNKFNTLNISDVYKRDKDTNINNNINNNNDNENKNITAQDILSKGREKINYNDNENIENNDSGTPMIKKLANAISENTTVSKTVTTTKDGKTTTQTTKFVIDKNNDGENYEGEFDISEEIDNKDKGDKGDYNEESKKSFGGSSNNNIGSFGFDSSIVDFNENDFDYIEDVDKP